MVLAQEAPALAPCGRQGPEVAAVLPEPPSTALSSFLQAPRHSPTTL